MKYFYDKIDNKRIQCKACKHFCAISEGSSGVCGVRINKNNRLISLVHNKPCSIAIDPIEKKPFYHFYPGESIFSIGTFGCNFKCFWCQNWEISQTPKLIENIEERKKFIEKNSYNFKPEEIVSLAEEYNTNMIAYTYNEPCVFSEYTYEISKISKKKGFKNVFVTSGYESDYLLNKLKNLIDAYNVDLKCFSDENYLKYCGAKLDLVLDTIEQIYKMKKHLEITTLIIPNFNDSMNELKEIANFIASLDKNIPWHVSAFYPCYKFKNYRPANKYDLEKALTIAREVGLNYVYLGNIIGYDNNTYCPKCGNILIERNYYSSKVKGIIDNKCVNCGFKIYGIFN